MKRLLLLFGVILSAIGLSSCGSDYFLDNYEGLTDKDHVYYNSEVDEILDILTGEKEGAYVIYFGFPSCPWCQALTPVLNEVAKDNFLDKKYEGQNVIYYYDIQEIRSNNSEEYQQILELLPALEVPGEDDELVAGVNRISVPYVVGVYNGEVLDEYMWDSTVVAKSDLNDEAVLTDLYNRLDILVEAVCGCDA